MISDENFKNSVISGVYGMLKSISDNDETIKKMRAGEPFTAQIIFQDCTVTVSTSIDVKSTVKDPTAETESPKIFVDEVQAIQHP